METKNLPFPTEQEKYAVHEIAQISTRPTTDYLLYFLLGEINGCRCEPKTDWLNREPISK